MDSSYAREAVREISEAWSNEDLDCFITTWLEINPVKPTRDEVRTTVGAVPVWAIVANLEAHAGDVHGLAAAYDLPVDAVRAALAYYRRNASAIDARIEANISELSALTN